MSDLKITNLYKRYGSVEILKDVNLDIKSGEFIVFVGPSGCGKSTLLRCISGLETISAGTLEIDGRVVNDVAPSKRGIAMVFQSYALYPHMTVYDNMAYALRLQNTPRAELDAKVREAAEKLQLTKYLERLPKALSGGQRQRVAMGRAIVRNPQVFCMDEPLSNLDAKMRVQTRADIAKLQSDLGVTTVYVTHDQVEAMTMGDRVAVMKLGVLQQVDTPLKLYDKPQNLFVAGFIGSPQMNLLEGVADEGGAVKVGSYHVPVDKTAEKKMQGKVTVGVRPETWRLVSDNEGGLPILVTVVEELGADSFVYGTSDVEGVPSNVTVRVGGRTHPQKGDTLYVTTDPEHVHVFDTESGERLSA